MDPRGEEPSESSDDEQVAHVEVETVGTPQGTATSNAGPVVEALNDMRAGDLERLRTVLITQGVPEEELVTVAEVRARNSGVLPDIPADFLAAAERGEFDEGFSGDEVDVEPGQRPSIVTSPAGRRWLGRNIRAILSREGFPLHSEERDDDWRRRARARRERSPGPAAVAVASSTEEPSPSPAPPAMNVDRMSTGHGQGTVGAVSSVATTAAPMTAAPSAAPAIVERTESVGVEQSGSPARLLHNAGGTTYPYGAVPPPTPQSSAPASTPRGAIASYGGWTLSGSAGGLAFTQPFLRTTLGAAASSSPLPQGSLPSQGYNGYQGYQQPPPSTASVTFGWGTASQAPAASPQPASVTPNQPEPAASQAWTQPPTRTTVPASTATSIPASRLFSASELAALSAWWPRRHVPTSTVPASPPVPTVSNAPPMGYGGGLPNTGLLPPPPNHSYGAWGTSVPTGQPAAPTVARVHLSPSIKNAVDLINPFYSDGSTVEKARAFWAEFERITRGMDDDLRMTVFRRCVKGKTGEDWWAHSRIVNFETLRIRFHNRFLCISPPQMMERLKNTKRSRGESVEEWADRIRDLCDEASILDSLMRYQYFLAGIRNSVWTAALQTTMVTSIEEAVMILLFKNMQIPVERDEDFAGDVGNGGQSSQSQMMDMMQQMQSMLAQQQQMLQAPRSPRNRSTVAPVQTAPVNAGAQNTRFQGIRQAADRYTQEGDIVCGRCDRRGHGRDTCTRRNGVCRRCGVLGHYSMECTASRNGGSGGGQGRRDRCGFCQSEDHSMANCPLVQVLLGGVVRSTGEAREGVQTGTVAPVIAAGTNQVGGVPVDDRENSGTVKRQASDRVRVSTVEIVLPVEKVKTSEVKTSKVAGTATSAKSGPSENKDKVKKNGQLRQVPENIGQGDPKKKKCRSSGKNGRMVNTGTVGDPLPDAGTGATKCQGTIFPSAAPLLANIQASEAKPLASERRNGQVKTSGSSVDVNLTASSESKPDLGKGTRTVSKEGSVVLPELGRDSEEMARDSAEEETPRIRCEVEKDVERNGEAKPCPSIEDHAPLFTDEELDAWEQGEEGPAEEEPEEYDKEIEERLYPLDEVALKRRMKENAERLKPPSTVELSEILGISEDVLERTRNASPGEQSTPEYWLTWFDETLAQSEEAKRANRDFRKAVESVAKPVLAVKARTVCEDPPAPGLDLDPGEVEIKKRSKVTVPVDEDTVRENLLVPLDNEVVVACVAGIGRAELGRDKKWRSLARQLVYDLVCEGAAARRAAEPVDPPDDGVPPERGKVEVAAFDEARARELLAWAGLVMGDEVLGQVLDRARQVYEITAPMIVTKILRRNGSRGRRASSQSRMASTLTSPQSRRESTLTSPQSRMAPTKRVTFDRPPRVTESEPLSDRGPFPEVEDDPYLYLEKVERELEQPRPRRAGLCEVGDPVDQDDAENGPSVVPGGKRVICSIQYACVDGVEAVSAGFIEDTPAKMLADTGAIVSLVDRKVLKRLGRASAPLRPYQGNLNGVAGSPLKVRGVIDLLIRLGSLEKLLPFVVAEDLHIDTVLGTDTLAAFRAVVDIEDRTMTLKDTGEVFQLGVTRVEETYTSRVSSSIRLVPGGQALVVADVPSAVTDKATVLVEGLATLDPTVRVARTLCTVTQGKVLVEVCNASAEEVVLERGTRVAGVTVVPESAFEIERSEDGKKTAAGGVSVSEVIGAVGAPARQNGPQQRMPGLEMNDENGLEVDFTGSKLSEEQQRLLTAELNTFKDLFVETSKRPGRTDLLEFSIDTGDHSPLKQRPYRVSQAEGEVMEAEIQQYLDLGLIRPSVSPWASPVLMIRKPDGGIRFCIDYRRLNAVTVKDCYPMPLIDDILDVLGNAKLFSTMDIASGYWNVPMAKNSVEKTAFTSKFGLFEWLVMPFGLCNAVPAFERLMENVLVDLKWRTCLVYLDDCVVFSEDFPTHLIRLRQVLERFRAAGFKLKMKKCHWGRDQVAFLGHIVTPSGILPNPEKVKAVLNVQRPHDLHTVRAFLGLTSYFRRYIPGYAAISAPIERLKQNGVGFQWTEDCESAFRQLKRRLMKPPILVYPDFTKRFKLFVDSSHLAVGACLMQEVDSNDRAIAYASKLLIGSQRNWISKVNGTSEIECWGIVWTTRKFRCYLDRREFDLYTDHKALTWVFSPNNRTDNAKLARWAMELSQLRFRVSHKPGTAMGHADGLSRLYTATVNAVTMQDLLNEVDSSEEQSFDRVGESGTLRGNGSERSESELTEAVEVENSDGTEAPPPPPQEEQEDEEQKDPSNVLPSPIDQFGLDREKFVDEQQRTPWIQALVAFLRDGALALDAQLRARTLQMAPHYTVENGALMRKVHLKAAGGHARSITVPVIPVDFIETVLHYCHTDVFAAHVGQKKTLDKVRKHAYWHGWKRDVTEYVRSCQVCGSGKGHRPWRNGLMQRMPVQQLGGPFSLLVVDAVGPLKETPRGNKFILVFVDYFTRWAEAFAVAALDTITFVEVMIDGVISRHGVPERLLSDRGSNFTSELARSLYTTLGIKKYFVSAYHPQTQGLVERFNGTLIGMLKMYVGETQQDWDLYLQRVLFAYRTSYHEALGDSPFFSLYGREPVLPLDLAFLNTSKDWRSNEVADYRRKLYLSLRDSRRLVERQLIKAQDRHERRLEQQVSVAFAVGDPVWVYQFFRAKRGTRTSKKLAFAWHGPYRVVGTVNENAYRIAIPSHPDRVVTVNVNRLKRFRGLWSRPFPTEVPEGVETDPGSDGAGPLIEQDLPGTSFIERRTIGDEETAFTNASLPVVDMLAKRRVRREKQYLVLLATYETRWIAASALSPTFDVMIRVFENAERSESGLPELRRSVRLADANIAAEDNDILF